MDNLFSSRAVNYQRTILLYPLICESKIASAEKCQGIEIGANKQCWWRWTKQQKTNWCSFNAFLWHIKLTSFSFTQAASPPDYCNRSGSLMWSIAFDSCHCELIWVWDVEGSTMLTTALVRSLPLSRSPRQLQLIIPLPLSVCFLQYTRIFHSHNIPFTVLIAVKILSTFHISLNAPSSLKKTLTLLIQLPNKYPVGFHQILLFADVWQSDVILWGFERMKTFFLASLIQEGIISFTEPEEDS